MSIKNFLKTVSNNHFLKYWFAGILILIIWALSLCLPTLKLTSETNGIVKLNSRIDSLESQIATSQERVLGALKAPAAEEIASHSAQPVTGKIVLSKASEVSLTITDPTLYTTTHSDIYCAIPKEGLVVYNGETDLNFFDQTLNLGKMEFVPGTPHNGQLQTYKLTNYPDHNFLALYQYGNCTFEKLYLVGWNEAQKQLIRYKFKQSGAITEELWVSTILPETSDSLVTESYDNIKREFITSYWNLNQLTDTFERV